MSTPAPAPIPETAAVSPFKGLIDVFVAPGALFERLRAKPTWLMAFLVMAVVAVATQVTMIPYTENAIRGAIQSNANLSGEQLKSALAMAPMQAKIGAFVIPVIYLIIGAISALLLWGLSTMSGGKATFKMMFAASMYTMLITMPTLILAAVIVHLRGGPETVQSALDLQWTIGPGAFIQTENHKLMALLNYINLFAIWNLAVTVIAVEKIALVKRGAAIVSAAVPWLLGLLIAILSAR